MTELPGISVFARDAGGTVFHTYSCYERGLDMMKAAYHYSDRAIWTQRGWTAVPRGLGPPARRILIQAPRTDPMNDAETAAKLSNYRREIADLRKKMRALPASVEPEEVADYVFATPQGNTRLSDLFGADGILL